MMDMMLIILQFLLFTLVEGFIYSMFFNRCCGCNKFKFWQIFIMSVGNYIIARFLPPLIYQGVMILWMGLFICFVERKFNYKHWIYPLIWVIIMLVSEMLYNICLETFNLANILKLCQSMLSGEINNLFILFCWLIPTKIFQILLIKAGESNGKNLVWNYR